MWCAGNANSHAPAPPKNWWVASADATKFTAVSCAPLGIPVDPEVATTNATSGSISAPARNCSVSSVVRSGSSAGTGRSVRVPAMASSIASRNG